MIADMKYGSNANITGIAMFDIVMFIMNRLAFNSELSTLLMAHNNRELTKTDVHATAIITQEIIDEVRLKGNAKTADFGEAGVIISGYKEALLLESLEKIPLE